MNRAWTLGFCLLSLNSKGSKTWHNAKHLCALSTRHGENPLCMVWATSRGTPFGKIYIHTSCCRDAKGVNVATAVLWTLQMWCVNEVSNFKRNHGELIMHLNHVFCFVYTKLQDGLDSMLQYVLTLLSILSAGITYDETQWVILFILAKETLWGAAQALDFWTAHFFFNCFHHPALEAY